MNLRNSVYTLGASGSMKFEFAGNYFGLLSIDKTQTGGYAMYQVQGYGVSGDRNSATQITAGQNSSVIISFDASLKGFVVANTSSRDITINILTWRGGVPLTTTI